MSYASKIKEKKLPWGGRVMATAFPANESVSIVGSVLGGERFAGSGEFSDIHASMLLEGTERHSKKEIQLALDAMGASLSFGAGSDRLVFSARVRTVHLKNLLALIAELLSEPSFPEAELNVLKTREEADLAMEEQDPNSQAKTAIARLLYKRGHPNYAESVSEARTILSKISSENLREYHQKILSGNSLIISFAGDITLAEASKLVDASFKHLPKKKINAPTFKKASITKPKRVAVPIKNKQSVTYIAAVATGITNEHKDFPALQLGIQILGNAGGFTGRLMSIVREKEGLTYGVYSYIPASSISSTEDGYIETWGTFAEKLFKKGRAAILREIKLITTEGASDEEVRTQAALYDAKFKTALSNSMAFARAAHGVIADGKKLSHLDEFPKKILKLTTSEVNKALKKYLVPAKLSEAAAGPVKKF